MVIQITFLNFKTVVSPQANTPVKTSRDFGILKSGSSGCDTTSRITIEDWPVLTQGYKDFDLRPLKIPGERFCDMNNLVRRVWSLRDDSELIKWTVFALMGIEGLLAVIIGMALPVDEVESDWKLIACVDRSSSLSPDLHCIVPGSSGCQPLVCSSSSTSRGRWPLSCAASSCWRDQQSPTNCDAGIASYTSAPLQRHCGSWVHY